jgi:uncharacterized protein
MHTLILPGWQNSGPDHWQSIWEVQHGYQRVMQHDWMRPLRGDWITRLEDHLLSINERSPQETQRPEPKNASKNTALQAQSSQPAESPRKVLLVAHSLGCHLIAAWAALSKNTHLIQGALLVAPPDAAQAQLPLELKSWRPAVLQRLPFKTMCVISSNDPFCAITPGRAMAAAWGSELVELGDKGHINAASGLEDWPQGQAMLARLRHL